MPELYCSSLPRIALCSGSALPADPAFGGDSPEARMGTAAHFAMHQHIDGNAVGAEEVAHVFDVDPDELGILFALSRRCWDQVKDYYPDPSTEIGMGAPLPGADGISLVGTADVLSRVYDAEEVRVLDWKGLALGTPLPTPTGWTTMGEVQPGDRVFGANGIPCAVVAKSEIHHRPCYRIAFDDGSSIVADNEHLWRVVSSKTGAAEVLQTEVIADRLKHRARQRDLYISNTEPLRLPDSELPIQPYTLGCWLGDGKKTGGCITKPSEEMFELIGIDGYLVGEPHGDGGQNKAPTRTVYGLQTKLRACGILGTRNIPDAYFRSSISQRLGLLKGLMDSDGTWNHTRGQAVFETTDPDLADAVNELVVSLGCRAGRWVGEARGFGLCVTRYRVSFRPAGFNPFAISAKAKKAGEDSRSRTRAKRRIIRSVEPIESVPTQCIAVDSPDHLYLAGKQMIPTHNTGREDYDHGQQLRGYAWLALQQQRWATFAHVALVRVREQTIDRDRFSRSELDAWAERLGKQLSDPPRYQAGEHCRFCPHSGNCSANTRRIRQSFEAIVNSDSGQLDGVELTPDQIGFLFDCLRTAERACEDVRGLIRARVAQASGTMPMSDGRQLQLTEQRQKKILPSAVSTLQAILGGWSAIEECLTIGKGNVEKAIAEVAPRGQKTARVKEVMEQLDREGHLIETIVERLEVRRSEQAITHEVTP